jgi:SAM-dependent methyltransferase
MKLEGQEAQKYFDKVPGQWDALYSHENWLKYYLNKWLRKALFLRYQMTFENCGDLTGATVLDIGCGTGRYSVECAKRGAAKVIGIDFAPSMIEYSKRVALQMGVADKCEFVCDDFFTHQFGESFDVILALGVFDYVKEPDPMFKKIAHLNPRLFTASFPVYRPLWDLQRKIRYYGFRKCPIYNYTRRQLENLFRDAPFARYQIIPCGKGLFGVGSAR